MSVCTCTCTCTIEASLSCVSSRLGPAGGVWYRELSEGVGQVWELQYLAVALEGTQGETHTFQIMCQHNVHVHVCTSLYRELFTTSDIQITAEKTLYALY